jgi:PST family polysaccharide transporter
MPDLLILEFARTLTDVLFPIYSQMQDRMDDMARAFFLVTRYISLVTIPMGLGLALVAEPFILTFFTDKWIEAVPVVRGIAIYATLLSIAHNTNSVYWARGRPQIISWLNITRLIFLFPGLLWAVTVPESIVMVSLVHAVVAFLSVILNFVVSSRLIGLPMIEIGRALKPAVLSGTLMALSVTGVLMATKELIPSWLLLVECVLVGGFVYLLGLWLFQRDIVITVSNRLRDSLGRV